ncbi:MAG: hypothetical protein QF567_02260, partial [Candidatus Pacearchaeota archaeon]|nr:hypothetical protein [Candidatus Pacearchaeota archaeon]
NKIWQLEIIDINKFALDKHATVDDTPFGGGSGMVMRVDVLANAIDKNVNFRHLLGYLLQFYKKMGFERIKFTPAYFPYTEPSVEISVWHPEKKIWLELGGAGIFRPEITIPLLGENIPVLAWGLGFDRIITDYYKIRDLREMYKNNLTQLRKMKFWIK